MRDEVQLGIFAKHWVPGQVKTRLAATIGDGAAARIYHAFLQCVLHQYADCDAQRMLVYAPDNARDAFAELVRDCPGDWSLVAQGQGNLGERLERFVSQRLAGPGPVIVLGSDSPQMDPDVVRQASSLLRDHDVVLGPSEDGGYYLLGVRRHIPVLFREMPWSSTDLLRSTIRGLQTVGVSYAMLAPGYDVDAEADLNRLVDDLWTRSSPHLRKLADRIEKFRSECEIG